MRFAALSLAVLAWAGAAPVQRAPVRIILDTDIGTDIDDAWALGLAMTSPEFELLAVTIADGDTDAPGVAAYERSANAMSIAECNRISQREASQQQERG
jgi:hypothetical protein